MQIDDIVLKNSEKAIFALRKLYSSYGYQQYKMSKFEEYDFYMKNKDFLVSDNLVTFTDTNGKLMALKPDVTLSIVKSIGEQKTGVRKVYYNENVYRPSNGSGNFCEIMQTGLECIGDVDTTCILEVLDLASQSLGKLAADYVIDISHMGILGRVLDETKVDSQARKQVLSCIASKNSYDCFEILSKNGVDEKSAQNLKALLEFDKDNKSIIEELKAMFDDKEWKNMVCELETAAKSLPQGKCRIDFSVVNDMNYYNGLVFVGFVNRVPLSVLFGGQYDRLLQKMGMRNKAIGFALYLDRLETLEDEVAQTDVDEYLNVALPKGRLGEKVYDMFAKAGFPCPEAMEKSRKLIFENKDAKVRYFWVKPSDVAIYVERGAADVGVVGKDILLEYEPDVYELLNLNTGICRMMVAAPKGKVIDPLKTLRVATKFTNVAQSYYSEKGMDIDLIHLNGSIEIAPIIGLSDVIVDIVETGTTLKENNLEVLEYIMPISARLVANKSSSKFKNSLIAKLSDNLAKIVESAKEEEK